MVRNLAAMKARLLRIPEHVKAAVDRQLKIEAADLAAAVKRAAPDDPKTGGSKLRDSVHVESNPRRDLAYLVVVDAKDEHGHVFAAHVEHGHRTEDGGHVAAHPFAFPIARARRPGMRRRVGAKVRKAFKES